jgi:CheY-like chemotaxis protein
MPWYWECTAPPSPPPSSSRRWQVSEGDEAVAALAATGQIRHVDPAHLPTARLNRRAAREGGGGAGGALAASAYPAHPPYDVVLLDIVFRYTDGLEVCQQLTRLYRLRVPIIATTGNILAGSRLSRAGFSGLLEKPFSVKQLDKALRRDYASEGEALLGGGGDGASASPAAAPPGAGVGLGGTG